MISSYVYIIACLALCVAALFALRWALAVRSLKSDARAEYAERSVSKPASIANVSETAFTGLYVASFQPRWALYAAGALASAVLASPLVLLFVTGVYELAWQAAGAPAWAGRTGYVFMFALFFGTVFLWALIGGAFARLHHKRTPEPFTHALARARGEPIPETGGFRRRPAWARRARPDPQPEETQT
ncbi:hypothetical protein GCM10011367_25010 [Marinicauda pacifica]|jgi:hypothetical protein|uniref:Uncharacterized protein n=1 Tax=Marinicauda pacifica TaxID=1133559 RepID=A0A4S2H9D0_9PROT|nr:MULTISPECIES: hypothetical protein [Marinicauda]TGY92467.1 hypothetical protein E5162_12580 [Marinicauda pacifica]GGE49180.1 hypothetical protein GCM10011367_25010 [Marinicauda pacifica]